MPSEQSYICSSKLKKVTVILQNTDNFSKNGIISVISSYHMKALSLQTKKCVWRSCVCPKGHWDLRLQCCFNSLVIFKYCSYICLNDRYSSQFYCRSEVDSCFLYVLFSVRHFSPTSVLAEARLKPLNSCSFNLNFSFLICKKHLCIPNPNHMCQFLNSYFSFQFNLISLQASSSI